MEPVTEREIRAQNNDRSPTFGEELGLLRRAGKALALFLAGISTIGNPTVQAEPTSKPSGAWDASNLYLTGGNYNLLDSTPSTVPSSGVESDSLTRGILGVDYDFGVSLDQWSMPSWQTFDVEHDFNLPQTPSYEPYSNIFDLPNFDVPSCAPYAEAPWSFRLQEVAAPNASIFDVVSSGYNHHQRETTPWGEIPEVAKSLSDRGLKLPEIGSGIGAVKRDYYSLDFTPPSGFSTKEYLNSLAQSVSGTVNNPYFSIFGEFQRDADSNAPIKRGDYISIEAFGSLSSMGTLIVNESETNFSVHTLAGHVVTGIREFGIEDLGNGQLRLYTTGDSQPSDMKYVPEWFETKVGVRLQEQVWKQFIYGARDDLTGRGSTVDQSSIRLGNEFDVVPAP